MRGAAQSTNPAFASRTLADIAATLPGATAVFRRRKLDFCCGGRVPLAEAAAAKGLALSELEKELEAIASVTPVVDRSESSEELIELIETRYHAAHRRDAPELLKLARRVEAVHKAHPAVPRGLADLLGQMAADLEEHMRKEEEILFPMMRRSGQPVMSQPVLAMMAEHDDHGLYLRELERLTADFTPPEDACATWRALYVGARKFADDLVEHIHTENNVLFPRFIGLTDGQRLA